MREKGFCEYKQSNDFYKKIQYRKATNYITLTVLLFLLFIPTLGGKQVFTRQIKVQVGKSTLIILFTKEKMPNLAGYKHPSVHFFLHGPRLFHLSTGKRTDPIRRKWTSKWSFPRRHKKNINKNERDYYTGKNY